MKWIGWKAEQSHLILIIRFPVGSFGSFSSILCHTIFFSLSLLAIYSSQLLLMQLKWKWWIGGAAELHHRRHHDHQCALYIMLLLLCVHAECWWIANGGQQRHQNDGWDKRSAMPWSRNISKALAVFFVFSPPHLEYIFFSLSSFCLRVMYCTA